MKSKLKLFMPPNRVVRERDQMVECVASMLEDNLCMRRIDSAKDLANGTFVAQSCAWHVAVTTTLQDRVKVNDFLSQWYTRNSYSVTQLPEAKRIRQERERRARLLAEIDALGIERDRLKKILETA
jgi:predicted lipoprotein